jgi:hypothetical protein
MVWDCWQAPEDSVSHGLWKERWGGVPKFIKEHVNANFQILGTALNLFSMKDNKNPIAIRWQEQPPPKTIFISVLQIKSSSTC